MCVCFNPLPSELDTESRARWIQPRSGTPEAASVPTLSLRKTNLHSQGLFLRSKSTPASRKDTFANPRQKRVDCKRQQKNVTLSICINKLEEHRSHGTHWADKSSVCILSVSQSVFQSVSLSVTLCRWEHPVFQHHFLTASWRVTQSLEQLKIRFIFNGLCSQGLTTLKS